MSDKHEQKMLDLYTPDLFCLRQTENGNNSGDRSSSSEKKATKSNNDEGESYDDLLDAVKNEVQELEEP